MVPNHQSVYIYIYVYNHAGVYTVEYIYIYGFFKDFPFSGHSYLIASYLTSRLTQIGHLMTHERKRPASDTS